MFAKVPVPSVTESSVLQKKTRCTSSSICSSPISSLRKTSLTKTLSLRQLMSPLLFTRRVENDLGYTKLATLLGSSRVLST